MTAPDRRTFLKQSSLLVSTIGLAALPAWGTDRNHVITMGLTRKSIPLWPDDSPHNQNHERFGRPRLELVIPEADRQGKRTAVIVCPGGGYYNLAPHEGRPFAELFAARGMVAAVLTYRVNPHRHPLPFADAARAIRLMRKHAESLHIDREKVGILGFSAGGHLAATVATQPDLHKDPHDDLVDQESARPDRLMLGYPVISFRNEYGHLGSARGLLGENPEAALLDQLSNQRHVTPKTPPAFLFHTADDPVVSVRNSLTFADACHRMEVPIALHVYPSGPHGVGLALDHPSLRSWTGLLLDWLEA